MPIFIFQNPKDENDIIEVIMSVHDIHEYSKDGIKWNRIFTAPTCSIDANIDPFSSRAFADKTNSKGTIGDIIDRSKEMSEKRKNKRGYDLIQDKHYENYSKERNGAVHPDVKKKKLKESLSKKGFTLE